MSAYDYCGEPGLVWYSTVEKKRGDELKIGDWLDSLDHSGARKIYAIGQQADIYGGGLYVGFSEWAGEWAPDDPDGDWEAVRPDVLYDIVDPDSICDPMGNPT